MSNKSIVFAAFVFFYTFIFNITVFNPTITGWIKNGVVLLFPILNLGVLSKQILEKEYLKINLLFLFWGLIVIYAGYENAGLSFDYTVYGEGSRVIVARRFDHAIYYVISIWTFVLFFESINHKVQYLTFLQWLFYFLLVYVIVSDINALIYNSVDGSGYLVGTKFTVCYVNLFLTIVYYLLHPELERKSKRHFIILLCLNLLIAIKTQCSTMVVGSVLLYIFSIVLKPKFKSRLYEIKTLLIFVVFFSIVFFYFASEIVNIPVMKYIIVDILGEDLTLTGRLNIYAGIAELLKNNPLFGYGIGNAHLITMMNEIGPNAQNGLFNLMIEIGLLGVIVYFTIIVELIKYIQKSRAYYPLLCFIYIMIVLSSVEITFSSVFLAFSIFFLTKPKKKYLMRQEQHSLKSKTISI